MSFITVSHWTATEMSDDLIKKATDDILPLIIAQGATAVQMVQTGALSSTVVTHYPDAATAQAAQAHVAKLREDVARDFSMTLDSAHSGEVIGSI